MFLLHTPTTDAAVRRQLLKRRSRLSDVVRRSLSLFLSLSLAPLLVVVVGPNRGVVGRIQSSNKQRCHGACCTSCIATHDARGIRLLFSPHANSSLDLPSTSASYTSHACKKPKTTSMATVEYRLCFLQLLLRFGFQLLLLRLSAVSCEPEKEEA